MVSTCFRIESGARIILYAYRQKKAGGGGRRGAGGTSVASRTEGKYKIRNEIL